jgi:hypothetical protein
LLIHLTGNLLSKLLCPLELLVNYVVVH